MGRANSGARMTRSLTVLFACAGGAAVSNLYWAQPLLAEIATAMDVSFGAAGLLMTLTQIGYALGVLLVVPLGDTLDRRRLIPAIMTASAIALAACAIAPSFAVLAVAIAAVGVTTVTGQLLMPLAGDLAADDERGRVVSSVVSGLMIGMLLSRTLSGLVADWLGWRAIFVFATVLMLVMAALLARSIPAEQKGPRINYVSLIASVFRGICDYRSMRFLVALGAISLAIFTMFWTSITFLLSEPPFSLSASAIGSTSLVGLVGAIAGQRIGRLHDRGLSTGATGVGILLLLTGVGIAAFAMTSIVLVLLAASLIGIGLQVVSVLSQTRVLEVDPPSRSRLNTTFMVGNFIGGAFGSALAALVWSRGGWLAITAIEGALAVIALTVWFFGRGVLAERSVP